MTSMRKKEPYFKEKYRPQFHYTAETNIINDPNGLVCYEGEYHLFHQYNINNRIHWGHAVSGDLCHWTHLEPALFPDTIGQIWSGSVVIDWNNTSGLKIGREAVMAAFYTYNEHIDSCQSQGMAFSRDRGRTWKKYNYNPVVTGGEKKDFRDPKVLWYDRELCWIMVLACGNHVEFFKSFDLTKWFYVGSFGEEEGSHEGVWECPDLFELPLEGTAGKSKWVLSVSVNRGAPAGGTGMQYFIGEFNGKTFTNRNVAHKTLWLDYGKDFYAGVTWNDVPNKKRYMIGWADNWEYRDKLPSYPFKGQFSCVRELTLKEEESEIFLIQKPVEELKQIRKNVSQINKFVLSGNTAILKNIQSGLCEIVTSFQSEDSKGNGEICIRNNREETVKIGYDFGKKELYLDRRGAGNAPCEHFLEKYQVSLQPELDQVKLQILVDHSQIEVFANDGMAVMTNLFFMNDFSYWIEASGNDSILGNTEIYELNSIWKEGMKSADDDFREIVNGNWGETVFGLEGNCHGNGCLLTEKTYFDITLKAGIIFAPYEENRDAGFLLGWDSQLEKGYTILLNREKEGLEVKYGEETLSFVSLSINQWRRYVLEVQVMDRYLEVSLDDCKKIKLRIPGYQGGKCGFYLNQAFVYLNDIQIK